MPYLVCDDQGSSFDSLGMFLQVRNPLCRDITFLCDELEVVRSKMVATRRDYATALTSIPELVYHNYDCPYGWWDDDWKEAEYPFVA